MPCPSNPIVPSPTFHRQPCQTIRQARTFNPIPLLRLAQIPRRPLASSQRWLLLWRPPIHQVPEEGIADRSRGGEIDDPVPETHQG